MEVTVAGLADWVATRISPNPQDQAKTSYNVRVIAFNAATAGLVLTGCLAVAAVISMYAAFVLGAVCYFVRNEVQLSLMACALPANVVADPVQARARMVLFRLDASIESEPEVARDLFTNLGLVRQNHPQWEIAAHRVFGQIVWRNSLPA